MSQETNRECPQGHPTRINIHDDGHVDGSIAAVHKAAAAEPTDQLPRACLAEVSRIAAMHFG